jgi:hypothetical protein
MARLGTDGAADSDAFPLALVQLVQAALRQLALASKLIQPP